MKVLNQASGRDWVLYHGDSMEVLGGLPSNSIHYGVTSPPFSSLYTYSNSVRDAGNCKGDEEFFEGFQYLIKELYRVLMPGRLFSLHCMNLPSTIQNHGHIGIRDFRGALIKAFINDEAADFYAYIQRLQNRQLQAAEDEDESRYMRLKEMIAAAEDELRRHPGETGFIYHSEVTIWKDPVTAMQRTKAIGLLHKQLCKDSSISRQGIPDYLVTMRKPGTNPEPISGELQYFAGEESKAPKKLGDMRDSINIWQRYASPVWMDINMSNTLQYKSARENNDERHICCLQLDVIERGVQLWSNPGDVVIDPFNGVGSTGHVCLKTGRSYVGCELKESYFNCAVNNLRSAEEQQHDLFSFAGMEAIA